MSCNKEKYTLIVQNCRLNVLDSFGGHIDDLPLYSEDISIHKTSSADPYVTVLFYRKGVPTAYQFSASNVTAYNAAVVVPLVDGNALYSFLEASRAACHDACCGGGGGGGAGATTFVALTDTPAAMGTPGQIVQVNALGTALEFADALSAMEDPDGDTGIDLIEGANDAIDFRVDGGVVMSLSSTKLTLNGIFIDPPTGMQMVPQAINPAAAVGGIDAETIWINSANGHLYRGSVDVEAGGASSFLSLTDTPAAYGPSGATYYSDGTQLIELPAGTSGQVLSMNAAATAPEWVSTPSGVTFYGLSDTPAASVPGSIYYGDGTNAVELGIGTAGQVLVVNPGATAPMWTTLSTDFNISDGVTTEAVAGGDTITFSGQKGFNLNVAATDLVNLSVPGTAAGDVLYFDGTDYQVLPIGLAGEQLVVNAGATAPEWAAAPAQMNHSNADLTYLAPRVHALGAQTIQYTGTGSVEVPILRLGDTGGNTINWEIQEDVVNALVANYGGVERFAVTSAGNARFNNAFTFPNTDGTVGQVLMTDGAGVVSWMDMMGANQSVVADIPARDAQTGLSVGHITYVADATGDASVNSGAAGYIWDGATQIKILELESIDWAIGVNNQVNGLNISVSLAENIEVEFNLPELANVAVVDSAVDRLLIYDDDGAVHGYVTPSQLGGAITQADTTQSDNRVHDLVNYSQTFNNSGTWDYNITNGLFSVNVSDPGLPGASSTLTMGTTDIVATATNGSPFGVAGEFRMDGNLVRLMGDTGAVGGPVGFLIDNASEAAIVGEAQAHVRSNAVAKGSATAGQVLTLINATTGEVDYRDGFSAYVQVFDATASWGTASGGYYTITVPQSTHGKDATGPIDVSLQEDDGTSWVVSEADQVLINKTSGDVSFRVPEVPDSRFAGRVIIK